MLPLRTSVMSGGQKYWQQRSVSERRVVFRVTTVVFRDHRLRIKSAQQALPMNKIFICVCFYLNTCKLQHKQHSDILTILNIFHLYLQVL